MAIVSGSTSRRDQRPYVHGLSPIDRFWSKVRKTQGCWLWTGNARRRRARAAWSAKFKVNGEWQPAARWIYVQKHGSVPKGLQVLHKCDNPLCVRDSHLFLGTQLDNIKDMKQKGRARSWSHPGELTGTSKLKESQVRKIIRLRKAGRPLKELSERFGVRIPQIHRIATGKRWSHICQ